MKKILASAILVISCVYNASAEKSPVVETTTHDVTVEAKKLSNGKIHIGSPEFKHYKPGHNHNQKIEQAYQPGPDASKHDEEVRRTKGIKATIRHTIQKHKDGTTTDKAEVVTKPGPNPEENATLFDLSKFLGSSMMMMN